MKKITIKNLYIKLQNSRTRKKNTMQLLFLALVFFACSFPTHAQSCDCGDGLTPGTAFTSLSDALNVSAAGSYQFNVDGQTFTTYVTADGYVQIAIDFGYGIGNLPQGNSLFEEMEGERGILNPLILAALTDIGEVRITHSGNGLDVTTTDSTIITRVQANHTLHMGFSDNEINDSWTGTNAHYMTIDATCDLTGSSSFVYTLTRLHENVAYTCGISDGIDWRPSTNMQRVSGSLGEIGDDDSMIIWVKGSNAPCGSTAALINSTSIKDDFMNTPYEVPVVGNVSTNDVGDDSASQSFALDGASGGMDTSEGTVAMDAGGSYTFTPAGGFSGETSFDYMICDVVDPTACKVSTVYLEVFPAIDPENPLIVANLDAHKIKADLFATGNVMSNDLDPDMMMPSITTMLDEEVVPGVDESGNLVAAAGFLTLNSDGNYSFEPSPGFTGVVRQSYTICNASAPAVCDESELIIAVLPDCKNTTFANDDATITDAGVSVEGDILTNDTDSEGDMQEISSFLTDSDGDGKGDMPGTIGMPITVGGTNDTGTPVADAGTLTLNADGTYDYEPAIGFAGNVIVPYIACDNASEVACEEATLVITVLGVKRDYGDAPAMYPVAWHRALTDNIGDDGVLDGTTDVWLGAKADFEVAQSVDEEAMGDDNDDAITFGSAPGQFPISGPPNTDYDVNIELNSVSPDFVFYGLWVDWDTDGTYDDFYSGSKTTDGTSTSTAVATITTPAVVGPAVNVRLRADDDPLMVADYIGGKTNGEVEDYQALLVLPVELTYFDGRAQDCHVQLKWISETEKAFNAYEVEWSGDGASYQTIKVIEGKGGTSFQTYRYTDEGASAVNYYRLKMVDQDGSFAYSKSVTVRTGCGEGYNTAIYPNPLEMSQGTVNVRFYTERELITMSVVDMLGRVVKQVRLNTQRNWNTTGLDITDLQAGTYTLFIEGKRISKRLVILK